MENNRKKEEPSWPNCSASSLRSFMMGTPASPTTILSAKFTSMNRNSRKVIFHAPFGVGCAFIVLLPKASCLACLTRPCDDASHGYPDKATGHFQVLAREFRRDVPG